MLFKPKKMIFDRSISTNVEKTVFSAMQASQSAPSVAIVLLNYNGKAYLQRFLSSIYATSYVNWDLYVVDNGSSDGSNVYLLQEEGFETYSLSQKGEARGAKQRFLLPLPENLGFAEGYNVGLEQIEADYYVLLNSDVEVPAEWLSPLIERLEANPQLAAVQPKICLEADWGSFEYSGAAGGFMDRWGYPFCRGRIFGELERDEGQYDTDIEVFWASGAALCIRAELFQAIGGLEGDFFAHMEEIDLCWRLKRANYKIGVVTESVVYHVGGGTLSALSPQKTYLNFRNSLLTIFRNIPGAKVWFYVFVRLLLDGIAGLRFLMQGQGKQLWAIVRAHWAFFGRIPKYWRKRKVLKERLDQMAYQDRIKYQKAGWYEGSIIWAYFAQGKKRFDELEIEEKPL